tara:strand:+ start:127 stop:276 length:150 start_codon:yes stop_codon:yes gene_type:complete
LISDHSTLTVGRREKVTRYFLLEFVFWPYSLSGIGIAFKMAAVGKWGIF